ncbi:phosphate ABC transporter permease PstA [Pontibaca methylaminivorans]|uniref:Phosphate transport system permease protein PstA n=1 Tax=Pontibaca methylaminivorans TaxID=515897 RepID=A0A1R3WD76_9RHOB|nr:phosphate ABC transporter permease PstA [Pontibaca methylaminivorans]SIT76118.1 phosphate ABC transporter membrane protein 2, PhoT family [Pontibaca methylaminivorans]
MTPHPSLFTRDPRTARRRAAEARFRGFGLAAVLIGVAALLMLLTSVLSSGLGAFRQTHVHIPVALEASVLDPAGTRDPEVMRKVTTLSYAKVIEAALKQAVADAGIAIDGLTDAEIAAMLSKEAPAQLRAKVLADPDLVGRTIDASLLANGRIDGYLKGRVTMDSAQLDRNVTPGQLLLADAMVAGGMMSKDFNFAFLTAGDASDLRPEAAGLGVAIIGSAYMMLIVLGLALPLGVATSIWLEEFAPKNRWTDLIEVNIANLAAVPSIVFGVLGLAIFINFAGLPQSAPIVGGLVLVLMTLPTVIIATRASLKAVPQGIRDAALGVGASRMQAVFHHVLPLAAPGILTGAIIGLAQALGETAPLLLIGMVAFVREFPAAPPEGFFDPASALPAQIYNWTQRSDPAFVERASGAIIVLLVFLLVMNAAAILLRRRFERRW